MKFNPYSSFLLLITLVGFLACKPELENTSKKVIYFDIKALLKAQAMQLNQAQAQVEKTIQHEDKQERKTLAIKHWEQELRMFEEANLNRPLFKGAYTVEDSTQGNSHFKVFRAKKDSQPIRWVRLNYDAKGEKLQSFLAKVIIDNVLYHSEKSLELTFTPGNKDMPLLSHYSIKGCLSMILGWENEYEIEAVVKTALKAQK
jgi:hypothetical protein